MVVRRQEERRAKMVGTHVIADEKFQCRASRENHGRKVNPDSDARHWDFSSPITVLDRLN